MTDEEFEDYCFENEFYQHKSPVCPYCKEEVEMDPYSLYSEVEEELYECPHCEKTFKLTIEQLWRYTTTPIKKEAEKEN